MGGGLMLWGVCWKGEEEGEDEGREGDVCGCCGSLLDTADLVLRVGQAFLWLDICQEMVLIDPRRVALMDLMQSERSSSYSGT